MKKHIIAPFLLLLAAAFVAAAQDNNSDAAIAARMAARRAAENGGAAAAPANAADTGATNAADIGATNAADAADADAGMPNGADAQVANTANTGATNAAAADPEEIARKARLAAAAKEAAASANLPGNLALLQIITQKNIFDPRRQPWSGNVPPPVVVRKETWGLRGISQKIGKGYLAFFEGDGVPSYPETRCVGDSVIGFKIKDITFNSVTLIDSKSTNNAEVVFEMNKGQQGLTRDDGGPWKPAYFTPDYQVATRGPRQADNGMGGGPQYTMAQPMMPDPNGFQFSVTTGQDDPNAFGGRGNRGRRNQQNNFNGPGGPGGRPGRQPGGFGGGTGGFGGGGGGANTSFAPPTVVDPNAPIDPIVLQRLQQRRQQEASGQPAPQPAPQPATQP
jgi:hypothetical protein